MDLEIQYYLVRSRSGPPAEGLKVLTSHFEQRGYSVQERNEGSIFLAGKYVVAIADADLYRGRFSSGTVRARVKSTGQRGIIVVEISPA